MPIGRYLKARLTETFPTPPSDSIWRSAFAVGMRREVVKNRSVLWPDDAAAVAPAVAPPTPGEIQELQTMELRSVERLRRSGIFVEGATPAPADGGMQRTRRAGLSMEGSRPVSVRLAAASAGDALDEFMGKSADADADVGDGRPNTGVSIDATFLTGGVQIAEVPYRLDSRGGRSGPIKGDAAPAASGRQRARSVLAGLYVPPSDAERSAALAVARPTSLPEFGRGGERESTGSDVGAYVARAATPAADADEEHKAAMQVDLFFHFF